MENHRKNQDFADKQESMQVPEVEIHDKLPYVAPTIKVIQVEVEKGFAASLNDYGDETA